MKKLLQLFSILLLFACADKNINSGGATVSLTLKNSLSSKVYLVTQVEDHFDTISEADIVKGAASIPYTIKYPRLMYLQFNNAKKPLPFYADEDGVEIDIETASSSPIVTISGSEMQLKLEEYQELERNFSQAMQTLQPIRVKAVADQYMAELLKQKEDSIYKNYLRSTLDFCMNGSLAGALVANQKLYDISYTQADSIYQNIPAIYSRAPQVVLLKEKRDILEKVDIGKPFTDIVQNDTLGNVQKLSTLVEDNNYVLVDFWASWCLPCRKANPELLSVYNDFHQKGFEIFSVSLDEIDSEWKMAIAEDQLIWPQVSQLKGFKNDAAVNYGIVAIPQSVLINKYGIIEVKNLNEVDLRTYLNEKL